MDDDLAGLPIERKVRLLTGKTMWRTHADPALGLRELVMSDGPIGVRGEKWDERDHSLALPSPSALAATWDEELVRRLGAVLAAQARRKGVDVLLAPTINLHRSPVTGRHFECFSEDPVLTARIGVAFIEGVQSGGVAATAKHYVANDSETDRMTLDARVDERVLRELYLAPFEAAVEAGVWVVMAAYNAVNGTTMTENPLLAEPLKGAWGFDGVVVSDWGAVRSVAASANAPQDLVMPGPRSHWNLGLAEAVRSGEVPESALDEKIRRLLRLAERVSGPSSSESHDDRDLLREAVTASTVLLRNEDGLLPLSTVERVAVIGPNAAAVRFQGGGSAEVYPAAVVSPVDGLRAALDGVAEVVHSPGVRTTTKPTPLHRGNATHPVTGEPGVLVRILDADGAELLSEHRLTGRLPEPGRAEGERIAELQAVLHPDVSGDWELSFGAWGPVSLVVDGKTVIDEVIDVDTDDPATLYLDPAWRTVTVALEADKPVLLVARRQLAPDAPRASVLSADAPRGDDEFARAVELARTSDVAVVVVGTTDESESEGSDRATLALPGRQDELVRAVSAVNPRTVVVVNSGAPVLMPWRDEVPAVLLSWLPGQEGGVGLADVLLGAAEPGGRLPTTWPAEDVSAASVTPVDGRLEYSEGLDIGHRGWLRSGEEPAYWFGHGLGYTTWEYSEVLVEHGNRVRVRLSNSGLRAGREIVQVYLSRPTSEIQRPVLWLAGFAAVTAAPGEAVEAVVDLPERAFEHWADGGWQREVGPFDVLVGRSAGDIRVRSQSW
ncbi:glycoside hydrolase family 3 C-terminal domain-containing protein [Allokutzneria sp. NRRL B-24872]|uniref:glycoside hydrolase family 3 C-terminal domain-containing protein n=1 Tax=Allokutzneria sp. NRRL B-24872 TaxID=1137961 RepID=UPI001FEE0260|nr:glycoside hydrolase family 3 C-terminal domain-containing protein [Allokutzneria sp. NRRL B-24872]